MVYDYKKGKERVDDILDNVISIEESSKIPKDDSFTFNNGYYSWVTAIFVDIRDSSELFSKKGLNDKKKTAKIVRAFTSEIIEILRDSDNLREIGIRGDCVYAIYTTQYQSDIKECSDKAVYVNTYLNMLNKLLVSKEEEIIKAGIGMASAEELVVKAGRSHTGINSKVWIGEAVTRASKLSALGQKVTNDRLFFSKASYDNFIELWKKENPGAESWFTKYIDNNYNVSYHCGCVISDFNDWINSGMK